MVRSGAQLCDLGQLTQFPYLPKEALDTMVSKALPLSIELGSADSLVDDPASL